jgi:hypothetical protein
VQLPFTAQNNSYSTTTLDDLCGRSGVNPETGYCNLFQPGVMPGKQRPEFLNLEEGKAAYNTDWDNFAPNVGVAWTPARRGGFLGALMSDEFVVRAGWARAYSRNGMGDFTGQYNSNPGVVINTNRTDGLGNLIPAGGNAPVLYRNDALLGAPPFPEQPVYPMTDVVTSDIRLFDPNINIPAANSWSAGIQRKLSTNMSLEVRYVGTNSNNAWQARNFNEINIFENNFLTSRVAQANLAGEHCRRPRKPFAFTGAPGTAPPRSCWLTSTASRPATRETACSTPERTGATTRF